ncbi:MurR/RpiR family transcriptional regulator [Clostridium sp. HCS.1]|uniref:MurR/RpiR family transcriptional regulator n=1 Tax=Clostridium sp. HCS.1 TaxID=3238594 RepID=UPI003A0FD988
MNSLILIKKNYDLMTNTEKIIADYILKNNDEFVKSNIHDMAEELNISSASISKFVKKYCDKTFAQLKIELAANIEKEAYSRTNEIFNWANSFEEMPNNIMNSISKICNDVYKVNGIDQFRNAIELINNAHAIYFFGIGSSTIIISDFIQKLMRIKKLCVYNTDSNYGVLNSRIATSNDVVIAVSFSGKTKEVNLAVREAKKSGAKCIAITRNSNSELAELADLILAVPSTELNATRLSPIFSRYGQLFIIDILFLGLAKKQTDSVEELLEQYQSLLAKLK